jgi:peptidyl-prolyl cis-trans isomerase C
MNDIYKLLFGGVVILFVASCSDPDVVATVNGEDVKQSTVDAYLKYKRIPVDSQDVTKQAVLAYLEKTALADAILKQDVLDAEAVEVEVAEFKKQMLVSRYFEKLLAEKVDQQAVKNYYTANQDAYQSKKVHVAHILFRTNPKMSEEERQALLTRAHEAYSKATSGEAFADLVTEYSDDKMSAGNGGDLGWVQEGAIDPAFTAKAFELAKDEVSQPVVTPFGYHVIKVLDEAQIITKPFEAVSGNIRYELRQKAKQAEMDRLQGLIKIEMADDEG